MTKQRTFKRRVRERMEKTGESYSAARRNLIPASVVPADFEPPVSEPALVEATGHGWAHWLVELDMWGAIAHSHRDIAAWLREDRGVAGWYAQAITVGFERARGLRAPGQRSGGVWVADATKTVHAPVERLYAAWEDELRHEDARPRTVTPLRTARYDWGDDGSRLTAYFEAVGPAKSRISVSHERLADADAVAAMKAHWRERLAALAAAVADG